MACNTELNHMPSNMFRNRAHVRPDGHPPLGPSRMAGPFAQARPARSVLSRLSDSFVTIAFSALWRGEAGASGSSSVQGRETSPEPIHPRLRNGPFARTKYAVVAIFRVLGARSRCRHALAILPAPSGAVRRALPTRCRQRKRMVPTELISPEAAGERVLRAAGTKDFYSFTHPQTRGWVKVRKRRLMTGFHCLDLSVAERAADR
jgi:hypothetical protein